MNTPPRASVGRARYHLRSFLSRGGMGEVWEALDEHLGRVVALKVVSGRVPDPLQEARLTAALEHPNIVPVHDAGVESDGTAWYAMRLVQGRTVRALLADRVGWPALRWAGIVLQLSEVLAYAHHRGVVHRDLKPDNVVLGPFGEVYLLDWGIALHGGATSDDAPFAAGAVNAAGPAAGSPGYRAPEQVAGRPEQIGPATDVWALGAFLWEVLEGEPLAAAGASLARRGLRGEGRRFSRLLEVALADDPGDRPADAGVFADLLRAELDGETRRAEAREWLGRAEAQFLRWEAAAAELHAYDAEESRLAAATPSWAPWGEKDALYRARRAATELRQRRGADLAGALADGERALALDPGMEEARDVVARAWLARLEAAEQAEDAEAAAFARDRVGVWGGERWAARLEPAVEVVASVGAAPAVVSARRWRDDGLVWTLSDPPVVVVDEGPTLALSPGRWQIQAVRGDARATVSIRVTRTSGRVALSLAPRRAVPGMCLVTGGRFVPGGDPGAGFQLAPVEGEVVSFLLGETPVTVGEYLRFLDDLPPDEARARAPRHDQGHLGQAIPLLDERDGRPVLPVVDRDGDPWDARYPVFGVSWDDARAYVGWLGQRAGLPLRLPTELEWEYAARSSDGRRFPWGNEFDASLCRMAASVRGRPQPCAVGSFPTDRSPFGVLDMAGLVREWCDDPTFDGDPSRRPVRGGCWNGSARLCRAANRYGYAAVRVDPSIGFRIALSCAPIPGTCELPPG